MALAQTETPSVIKREVAWDYWYGLSVFYQTNMKPRLSMIKNQDSVIQQYQKPWKVKEIIQHSDVL